MQINVDFSELPIMSPHQAFGGVAGTKSQAQFSNLLAKDKQLNTEPLDSQQQFLDQVSSDVEPMLRIQDALISSAQQIGLLIVDNRQQTQDSERPEIKLLRASQGGLLCDTTKDPHRQSSGLQQYDPTVLLQQHAEGHRVCQYSLWQLMATGNQSYEGQSVIQTGVPVLTSQTVTQGNVVRAQRPRLQIERSPWNEPSSQVGDAGASWCWVGVELDSSADCDASTNETGGAATVWAPDEFMQMLQKENLLVLPEGKNKERLYYRNFVSHNPEHELRQMWQLVDVVSSRNMDFYVNGRYRGTGMPDAD